MMLQPAERVLALKLRLAELSLQPSQSLRHRLSRVFLGSAVTQPPSGQSRAEGKGQNNSDEKCRSCHGLPPVWHTTKIEYELPVAPAHRPSLRPELRSRRKTWRPRDPILRNRRERWPPRERAVFVGHQKIHRRSLRRMVFHPQLQPRTGCDVSSPRLYGDRHRGRREQLQPLRPPRKRKCLGFPADV